MELPIALEALEKAFDADPRIAPGLPPRFGKFLHEGWWRELARLRLLTPDDALAQAGFAVAHGVPEIDELAFVLRRRRDRSLDAPIAAVRESLDAVTRDRGLSWLPRLVGPRASLADVEAQARSLGLEPANAFEVERVFSREAVGSVVALERRGLVENGRLVLAARIHVASGEAATPRLELLEAAHVALESVAKPPASELARLARALDRSDDQPAANGEAVLRFALGALERARAVPEARRAVLDFLVAQGLVPLAVEAGARFDPEVHTPASFERRTAPGGAGVVLATLETGFRDAQGALLSRAIVLVGDSG